MIGSEIVFGLGGCGHRRIEGLLSYRFVYIYEVYLRSIRNPRLERAEPTVR